MARLRAYLVSASVAVLLLCAVVPVVATVDDGVQTAFAKEVVAQADGGNSKASNSKSDDAENPGAAEETPLEKTKRLIEALPADPDSVTEADRADIDAATNAYNGLSKSDQEALHAEELRKDQPYDRCLESAQWGLEVLAPINDFVPLLDGDYSEYVTSSSSMGKSVSQRARTWSVSKLIVSDMHATATIRCDQQSSFSSMRIGNVNYPGISVDGAPQFDVPLRVNGTSTFTVRANAISDAVAYQITMSLPMEAASADEVASAKSKATDALTTASSKYIASDATLVEEAAANLDEVASISGITAIELDVASKKLSAALDAATLLPPKKDSDSSDSSNKSSSSSSKSSKSSSSKSSSSKSSSSSNSSSSASPSQNTTRPSGTGRSQAVPAVSSSKTNSAASSSKDSASKKKTASGESEQKVESASSSVSQPQASVEQVTALSTNQADEPVPWTSVIVAGVLMTLLVGGMCAKTLMFIRAKDVVR